MKDKRGRERKGILNRKGITWKSCTPVVLVEEEHGEKRLNEDKTAEAHFSMYNCNLNAVRTRM